MNADCRLATFGLALLAMQSIIKYGQCKERKYKNI